MEDTLWTPQLQSSVMLDTLHLDLIQGPASLLETGMGQGHHVKVN